METVFHFFVVGCSLIGTGLLFLLGLEIWWEIYKKCVGIPKLVKAVKAYKKSVSEQLGRVK